MVEQKKLQSAYKVQLQQFAAKTMAHILSHYTDRTKRWVLIHWTTVIHLEQPGTLEEVDEMATASDKQAIAAAITGTTVVGRGELGDLHVSPGGRVSRQQPKDRGGCWAFGFELGCC